MAITILTQTILMPSLCVALASLLSRWRPIVILCGFWLVSLWIKGGELQALDSIAIALSIAVITGICLEYMNRVAVLGAYLVLAVLLCLWQVKNFAADLSLASWVIEGTFLIAALAWPFVVNHLIGVDKESANVASQDNTVNRLAYLLWVVPLGYMAVITPIAGSVIIGQMLAVLAVLFAGLVVLSLFNQAQNPFIITLMVSLPSFVGARMAWHYAEVSWYWLLIGFVAWLFLLIMPLYRIKLWPLLFMLGGVFLGLTGIGLYFVWPEGSLY